MIERFYNQTINVKRLVVVAGTDKEVFDEHAFTIPCYYEKLEEWGAKLWCEEIDIVEGDEVILDEVSYIARQVIPYTQPAEGQIHHLEIILELVKTLEE